MEHAPCAAGAPLVRAIIFSLTGGFRACSANRRRGMLEIMTHVRFSISTLMFVVLVIALNLYAGGPFYGPNGMEWLVL